MQAVINIPLGCLFVLLTVSLTLSCHRRLSLFQPQIIIAHMCFQSALTDKPRIIINALVIILAARLFVVLKLRLGTGGKPARLFSWATYLTFQTILI